MAIEIKDGYIEVSKADLDTDCYRMGDFEYCRDVFNGIAYKCAYGSAWHEGMRNTIAVDLSIASRMLELDVEEVYDLFVYAGLINPSYDDQNTAQRFEVIAGYLDDWIDSNFRNYMLDDLYWVGSIGEKPMPFVVKLV